MVSVSVVIPVVTVDVLIVLVTEVVTVEIPVCVVPVPVPVPVVVIVVIWPAAWSTADRIKNTSNKKIPLGALIAAVIDYSIAAFMSSAQFDQKLYHEHLANHLPQ